MSVLDTSSSQSATRTNYRNRLKLELTAPPVQNKANDACIRFFAELLKVPRSSVTIAANPGSRNKAIRISGVVTATAKQAVAAALGL